MNKPTFNSLAPTSVAGFSPYRYGTSRGNTDRAFDAREHVSPQAVASIHKAFVESKTSRRNWKGQQREGRLDVRTALRAQPGDFGVFKRKVGHSVTRVHCAVLLDDSGSMGGTDIKVPDPLNPRRHVATSRRVGTAIFGATIATALGRIPTVDLNVYQHGWGYGNGKPVLQIKWRWSKGTPVAVFNEAAVRGTPGGGNGDGHAIHAITEVLTKKVKRYEKGVLLVVSDGQPADHPITSRLADQALIDAVAEARRAGLIVFGVAFGGSTQREFEQYYGKDWVLPFTGDWTALGKELAHRLGKELAK